MYILDARGLACPQPVILTRKEMMQRDELQVLVSGHEAVQNITRLAEKSGWTAEVTTTGDEYTLTLKKGATASAPAATPSVEQSCAPFNQTVILCASSELGHGPAELGGILIKSYFYALGEVDAKPQTIILINSGVTLAVEGSPVLEALQKLASQGVEILVCGTCLGYLELRDKLAVGSVSNMYAIAETLLNAGNTIRL